RELTVKPSQTIKIRVAAIIVLALTGAAFYQLRPEPPAGLSEDQFRSEIERNLRIEMKKESVSGLYASAEFTAGWERDLWADVQELRQLLGREDGWLQAMEPKIFQSYLKAAEESIVSRQLDLAQSLLESALRYGEDDAVLDALVGRIAAERAAIADEKAEQRRRELAQAEERRQAAVRAEEEARKNSEFDQAMANLRRQLQCHGNINMSDFSIALGQLKVTNPSRYTREEGTIARSLASCIESIGASFPERAEAAKREAMTLFTRNATIAAISITPLDPCSASLAG